MNLNLKLFFWITLVLSINYANAQTLNNNLILDLLNSNQNITYEMLVNIGFEQKDKSSLYVLDNQESLLEMDDMSRFVYCCSFMNSNYYTRANSIVIISNKPEELMCQMCISDIRIIFNDQEESQFLRLRRYFNSKENLTEKIDETGLICFRKIIEVHNKGSVWESEDLEYEICFKTEAKNNKKRHILSARKFKPPEKY